MNYELIKKLYEEGFAQTGKGEFYRQNYIRTGDEPDYYIPTLSELIEACGKPFMLNIYESGQCQAFNDTHTTTNRPDAEGETPEESVAKLWLELNKK